MSTHQYPLAGVSGLRGPAGRISPVRPCVGDRIGRMWYRLRMAGQKFVVEIEREADGRWIAEVLALPGAMAYGASRDEALAKAEVLALRVLADRLEHGEAIPAIDGLFEAA